MGCMPTTYTSDGKVEERTERIGIPVNPAEKRKFERLAQSERLPLSVYIRKILHEIADTKKGQAA